MPRPKIIESQQQLQERRRVAVLARMLRAAIGWSQRELGAKLGVSHNTIAQLEQGRLRLNPTKLGELLTLFKQAGLRFRQDEGGVEIAVGNCALSALDPETGLTLPPPISDEAG